MINYLLVRTLRKQRDEAIAQRDAALEAVRVANEHLAGIQLRIEQRAALISIVRDKRHAKFLFVRNGELTEVHTYITLDQDWNEIERRLLRHG